MVGRRIRVGVAWLFTAVLLAAAGCRAPGEEAAGTAVSGSGAPDAALKAETSSPAAAVPDAPSISSKASRRTADPALHGPPRGASVEGRPIEYLVFGYGPDVTLILGGIHGNEPGGAALARALCSRLRTRPLLMKEHRVVVVPEANPDGLAAGRRLNARGVDLNRNFDTGNRRASSRYGEEAFSEPESRFIAGLIAHYQPARIVSIHSPEACVDWDGPAEPTEALAQAVSAACSLPARRLGTRPGSLGAFAGVELEIPIITLELPRAADRMEEDALWRAYGSALMAAVLFKDSSAPPGLD